MHLKKIILCETPNIFSTSQGRTLCRLNNLPISTLSTTPHLLHTRTFLVLPYDTKVSNQSHIASVSVPDKEDPAAARDRVKQRTLERAAKRFQIVTKEEDWRIANAYVALAASDSPSGSVSSSRPLNKEEKEWSKRHDLEKLQPGAPSLTTGVSSVLSEEDADAQRSGCRELRVEATARAVDAYLDDDDWEAQERARGRGPSSRLGSESSSQRAGGRGLSSWFSAWKSEKAL